MTNAVGMVARLLNSHPELCQEVMVIAVGAGVIGWTHVTDSAFWVVKEYLGVPLTEALKKIAVETTPASVVALCLTLMLSDIVR